MSQQGPVLVRIDEEAELLAFATDRGRGGHVRGRSDWDDQPSALMGRLKWLRIVFLLLGLGGLGYYGYTLADEHVYQAYQNWAFEQQIAGRPAVTFSDYVREKTAFGSLAGPNKAAIPVRPDIAPSQATPVLRPVIGSLLGRVEIPRLNLSAIVREGSDSATLSRAVGHVPSTSLAGEDGNFSIAAHRDTLFRALKDIRTGDLVTFQTTSAAYHYQVFSTRIVRPSEISVLRPDAGLPANILQPDGDPRQLLTMITCYPFYYVGSAPQRFIVTARLVDNAPLGLVQAASKSTGANANLVHKTIIPSTRRVSRPSRAQTRASPRMKAASHQKRRAINHKVFHTQ